MKIKINTHIIDVKKVSGFGKFLGLMFKQKNNADALLFEFNKPTHLKIHSFFVFFPFIAVWLDEDNKLIEIKKIEPFRLSIGPNRKFSKLIEIPINKKYKNLCKFVADAKHLNSF